MSLRVHHGVSGRIQQLLHRRVALGFGQAGGAAALGVAQAAVGTQGEQGAHHALIAARGGLHQRGLPGGVAGVDIGTRAGQLLHRADLAARSGLVQRRGIGLWRCLGGQGGGRCKGGRVGFGRCGGERDGGCSVTQRVSGRCGFGLQAGLRG